MIELRVCPGCGHVDPPEWKHSKHSYWIDHIKWEDFVRLYPKLAEEILKDGTFTEDQDNVYRRTRNKTRVERKAKIDYGYQWSIPMEKVKQQVTDFRKCWNRDKTRKLEEFFKDACQEE